MAYKSFKKWYNLKDSAVRLTKSFGENVTVEDVLNIEHELLPISIYCIETDADLVAPYTVWNLELKDEKSFVVHDGAIGNTKIEGVLTLYNSRKNSSIQSYCLKNKSYALHRNIEEFRGCIFIDEYDCFWSLDAVFNCDESYEIVYKTSDIEAFEVHQNNKKKTVNSSEINLNAKNSLLKIIISMAVDGYRYDPHAKRNDAIKSIESATELLGVHVSDDTIRGWLKEAKKLLPLDSL